MANNPLNTDQLTYFFEFFDAGFPPEYQIDELPGSDALNFVNQQDSKRWARSVEYGAVDSLTSIDAIGRDTGILQTIDILGNQSTRLDYGLNWLLLGYKQKGFQFKVNFVIKKSGLVFNRLQCDFSDKNVTDGYTYVKFKLIQQNKVANLKRRLDDKFNLFGTVNAKNEVITPATAINFLRIATPITSQSVFNGNGTPSGGLASTRPNFAGTGIDQINTGTNNANKVVEYGINNTLSFLSPTYATVSATDVDSVAWQVPNDSNSFTFLEAKNDLSNVQVEITNIIANTFAFFTDSFGTNVLTGSGHVKLLLVIGNDLETEPFTVTELWSRTFNKIGVDNSSQAVPSSFSLTIPVIERGKRVYIYFATDSTATFNNYDNVLAGAIISVSQTNMDVKFTATETALNTVIKGVRWIDGIKQADKFGSNIGVNASLFASGGIHYDNVIFNRAMVSQRIDNFTTTPKILFESVEEVNCDYEPDENEIFIGHQSDFYENVEIGVFNIIPDEDFSIQENERCMINKHQYKYKTFQQDRTVLGTSGAIHTESEWRFLNDQVENVKEVSLELIRDPFTHQAMVDLEISQPSTSTSDDDKVNIVEITSLAPSSFNEFGARLLMRINDGKLEILNRDSNGDSSNVVINWTILGFSVGDTIQITFGENVGSYTVDTLTTSVLTLVPISFTPAFEGDAYIKIKYYYTNVLYVTRTSQGFISNPNGLQNANYSIKRNMKYFGEYYASCLLYEKSNIPNAFFKSNGTFTSQLDTETNPITENATILYNDLPTPLTTAKLMTANCVAEFEDILEYLRKYKFVARGFVRLLDSQGNVYFSFLQKLDQLWQENRLKTIGEERFQTENLILTFADGILIVNDVVYNLSGVENWWRADNDYFKFYDALNRPLSNYYRFNFVELNGVTYESKEDLINALLSL